MLISTGRRANTGVVELETMGEGGEPDHCVSCPISARDMVLMVVVSHWLVLAGRCLWRMLAIATWSFQVDWWRTGRAGRHQSAMMDSD
jgi:hypothetical protein